MRKNSVVVALLMSALVAVGCGSQNLSDLNDFSSLNPEDSRTVKIDTTHADGNQYMEFRLCADAEQEFGTCDAIADGQKFATSELLKSMDDISAEEHTAPRSALGTTGQAITGLVGAGIAYKVFKKMLGWNKIVPRLHRGVPAAGAVIVIGAATLYAMDKVYNASTDLSPDAREQARLHEMELNAQLSDASSDQQVADIDELVSALEYVTAYTAYRLENPAE